MLTTGLESFLRGIENHPVLGVLGSIVLESLWSALDLRLVPIQTRSWHFKFETLPIEHLVVVESRRSGIETDFPACYLLEVLCSLLSVFPFLKTLDASDLSISSKHLILHRLVVNMLATLTCLASSDTHVLKDSYAWIFS